MIVAAQEASRATFFVPQNKPLLKTLAHGRHAHQYAPYEGTLTSSSLNRAYFVHISALDTFLSALRDKGSIPGIQN